MKAGLVRSAAEFPWSSARFHLEGKTDSLIASSGWLSNNKRSEYCQYILDVDEKTSNMINQATRSGRPLCSTTSLVKLEKLLGRSL